MQVMAFSGIRCLNGCAKDALMSKWQLPHKVFTAAALRTTSAPGPLKLLRPSANRPSAADVAEESALQPIADFLCHFEQRQVLARTGRALDLKVIAKKSIQIQQGPDKQHINRHPDRTPPIGVPAEHTRVLDSCSFVANKDFPGTT
jgi:hypothetical protein